MLSEMKERDRLLLLDTVGDRPGIALVEGETVLASAELAPRAASAALLTEIRRVLSPVGCSLRELSGVGVVSGPGSFTGVRTGLAAAKGLCEAAGLPLAAVSRLRVLAEAAKMHEGFAVLDAGRGALYVQERRGGEEVREFLATVAEFEVRVSGASVVVAEEKLMAVLTTLRPRLRELRATDMVGSVRRCLAEGGTDVMWAEANYVQAESEIYRRPHSARRETKGA